MEEKEIKKYFVRFLVLCFAAFILYATIQSIVGTRKFKQSSYSGIITDKVYLPGHRGAPDVKIDTTWHYFGSFEWDVSPIIKIGDSIVKNSGSKRIHIYRKNARGIWVEVKY